ncbi:MAG: protein-arginine deiminase family protein [Cyanobacteria bacterium J06633_8]
MTTYVFQVRLGVDSNRDGIVDFEDNGRANWVYGDEQQGAVLLVNNDRDISDAEPTPGQYSEWSELVVEPTKVNNFPEGISLVLRAKESSAQRFSVYMKDDSGEFQHILGKNLKDTSSPALIVSPPLPTNGVSCYVEAHEFPGADFEGLINIELLLLDNGVPMATDKVIYRVAPWIMTPNTLPPIKVYACEILQEGANPNQEFLSDLRSALDDLKIPLEIIPESENLGDRWIQDEIEFGYIQGATHTIPVVFDSPRDQGLDGFPEAKLLGPDFGHFQIGGSTPNSLDSFGNLEVSPPVTVKGRHYPFGRIVFGGRKTGDYSENSRQMMPELRRFFYAQKVQSPFEIYTDWLIVGHADEIMCFVPAANNKGFQVLVASPERAHMILNRLADEGYGDTVMFEGMKRGTPDSSESAEIKIAELLADKEFWEANHTYQSYMNQNNRILRQELDIDDRHIIQIPVLFGLPNRENRTSAYFPDMINHLVLGKTSLVPKPKGPIINGKCAFEKAFEEALPRRNVRFIENWYSYHQNLGEVHCGTNTRRKPFPNKRWWNYKPDGGYDI